MQAGFPLLVDRITEVTCHLSSCEFELDIVDALGTSRAVRLPLAARFSRLPELPSQQHQIFKGRIVEYGFPLPAFISSYIHHTCNACWRRSLCASALLC